MVPVLSVSTCTTCLRVGMFYCGLESYKQTNHVSNNYYAFDYNTNISFSFKCVLKS